MLYLILMPLSGKNNYIDNMSKEAQDHYNSVKKDRRIKGCASIIISILLGLFINMKLVKKVENKQRILIVLFVVFGSMSIIYEIMWQDRFIFEERDINRMVKDEKIDTIEKNDIILYSKIYKKSRLTGNIIEVISVIMTIIFTIIIK